MEILFLIPILLYLTGFLGFIFICYGIYRMNIEQKKTNMLLKRIYEHQGGKLLDYEIDELKK
ncbi:hypothetical protein [Pedobacter frigoris]|uniref:hypothetical protein n=1 Tax=Pedobacter frigoris TaxID=2571272 RepID=UPI00292CDBB5|nr:hypothetical protein [Pedobacter frigoris]